MKEGRKEGRKEGGLPQWEGATPRARVGRLLLVLRCCCYCCRCAKEPRSGRFPSFPVPSLPPSLRSADPACPRRPAVGKAEVTIAAHALLHSSKSSYSVRWLLTTHYTLASHFVRAEHTGALFCAVLIQDSVLTQDSKL